MIFSMKRGKSLGLLKSCLELSCCSVALSCASLCDPMECSMPGFCVLHHLPQFAQIHVHCVGDAIQPSHPFWSPSPPGFNLSKHQGWIRGALINPNFLLIRSNLWRWPLCLSPTFISHRFNIWELKRILEMTQSFFLAKSFKSAKNAIFVFFFQSLDFYFYLFLFQTLLLCHFSIVTLPSYSIVCYISSKRSFLNGLHDDLPSSFLCFINMLVSNLSNWNLWAQFIWFWFSSCLYIVDKL